MLLAVTLRSAPRFLTSTRSATRSGRVEVPSMEWRRACPGLGEGTFFFNSWR